MSLHAMDWGEYMNLKKQKLLDQYEATTSKNEGRRKSDIFKDVAVFVNGLTDPSSDEIKTIMRDNGGIYHVYYDSKRTDFIIASNLAETKIKQLGKIQKVVKPSWITDCLKSQKLLDYKPYLLYSNTSDRKINDYLQSAGSSSLAKDANDPKFLDEFYKNSRLHHISTLSATFKQLISEFKSKTDGQFPQRDKLREYLQTVTTDDGHVLKNQYDCVIMHIDIDCFFVSVGLIKCPQFRGLPVAITHAKTTNAENYSMSEIASCSYEAREKGVKNGMYLGEALKLCPDLKVLPYEFETYRKIGYKFYYAISLFTLEIEAVSCDEMYVDVTELLNSTGASVEAFATFIRHEIESQIQCPCSTGFGSNKLLARLATKFAKPNGQFYLNPDLVDSYMKNVNVEELPGVGYVIAEKLKSLGVENCGHLRELSLTQLKNELGAKVGETLYNQCRGVDKKQINSEQLRKSVSAEVNYGIRFEDPKAVEVFLGQLCHELWRRLVDCKMCGKCITLKIMVRMKGTPMDTAKFMGHGMVDKVSKSATLMEATSDEEVIKREVLSIYKALNIEPRDLRGVGVQMTRLEQVKLKSCETKSSTDNILQQFLARKSSCDVTKQLQPSALVSVDEEITLSSDDEVLPKIILPSTKKLPEALKRKRKQPKAEVAQKGAMLKFLKKDIPKNSEGDVEVVTISDDDTHFSIINIDDDDGPGAAENDDNVADKDVNNVLECLSYSDFKMLVKDWLSVDGFGPKFSDVMLLGYFLKGMVQRKLIERVKATLDFISKTIKPKNNPEWNEAFQEIVKITQRAMREQYEGELLLAET